MNPGDGGAPKGAAPVRDQLGIAGFEDGAAREIARLLVRCETALADAGGSGAATRIFVPGRVEVLGKHTDYAGGRSLIAAVDRGFIAVASPRGDGVVRMIDAVSGEHAKFEGGVSAGVTPVWGTYPQTVARRLTKNFPEARSGADLVFASNLPPAAGMSSSSAFMIATFLGIAAVNDLASSPRYRARLSTPEHLAEYLACVENGSSFGDLEGDHGVGTKGGSEDHTAILCGRPGELLQYSFAPLRFERSLPFPEDYSLVIGASGVLAEKTGGARERYNRSADRAKSVVGVWNQATGRSDAHIAAALEASADAGVRLREIVASCTDGEGGGSLLARLDQFLAESEEIIPAASDALVSRDLSTFGTLVDRSQRLADALLGNQVEETIHLAKIARDLGAVAASAFGAGFGGSVWAMVERAGAHKLREAWRASYLARFPERAATADFFEVRPGPAALTLDAPIELH